MSDTCEPAQLIVSSRCPHSQILLADIARVGCIAFDDRFPHNYFAEGDAPGSYFLDRCAIEVAGGLDEKLVVGVVLGVALVVELDHVEVDEVAYLAVYGDVGSVFVVFFLEVRGLGSVDHDVVGDDLPQGSGEGYHPALPCPCFHGCVIFPIDVNPVKVVVEDEAAQLVPALFRVLPGTGGMFSPPESAHQQFDPCIIELLPDLLLDLLSGPSQGVTSSEVVVGTFPHESYVKRVPMAFPEGQEHVVVVMGGSVPRHSQILSDVIPPPVLNFVHVAQSDGVAVGGEISGWR